MSRVMGRGDNQGPLPANLPEGAMTSSESQPRTAAGMELRAYIAGYQTSGTGPITDVDARIVKIEAEAAQDSRPLDVEQLARLDREFDETAWKEIPGFPPDDPELEHREKAEWMVKRLVSREAP